VAPEVSRQRSLPFAHELRKPGITLGLKLGTTLTLHAAEPFVTGLDDDAAFDSVDGAHSAVLPVG
jgi:hypothetical protein